ncbi:MAG: hypothetical protein R6X12_09310 [bacterium]
MRCVTLLLLVLAASGQAQLDSSWISHYNGNEGWFEFQGPERAMRLDPTEFGLDLPVEIESLKIWFYWGMGSLTDSVFTFRIYADDGRTLLFESDSLTCPSGYWVHYGLPEPVLIESGTFWIVATARSVNPWAHPYINTDDNGTPVGSFHGSPGAWTQCTSGEYCFFAYACECVVGMGQGRWSGPTAAVAPLICRGELFLPGAEPARLVTVDGRGARLLAPGDNRLAGLAPGVYYLCRPGDPVRRVTVLH